jgi:hypothetical protein
MKYERCSKTFLLLVIGGKPFVGRVGKQGEVKNFVLEKCSAHNILHFQFCCQCHYIGDYFIHDFWPNCGVWLIFWIQGKDWENMRKFKHDIQFGLFYYAIKLPFSFFISWYYIAR